MPHFSVNSAICYRLELLLRTTESKFRKFLPRATRKLERAQTLEQVRRLLIAPRKNPARKPEYPVRDRILSQPNSRLFKSRGFGDNRVGEWSKPVSVTVGE
jgi:hypothetical protein